MADWVTGKVTKVQNWTDALFSLTVHAPVLPFTAGQFTKLGLELLDELHHDRQQNFARSMVVLCSQLIDGFFRAGLAAGQQVRNGAVTFSVPDFGVALVLTFDEGCVPDLVKLPFHIREGCCQIIRVLWVESRTETVEAVPVDVALGSFRVDVLTVGKVETAVIVLGVIGAVGSGSSVVSC